MYYLNQIKNFATLFEAVFEKLEIQASLLSQPFAATQSWNAELGNLKKKFADITDKNSGFDTSLKAAKNNKEVDTCLRNFSKKIDALLLDTYRFVSNQSKKNTAFLAKAKLDLYDLFQYASELKLTIKKNLHHHLEKDIAYYNKKIATTTHPAISKADIAQRTLVGGTHPGKPEFRLTRGYSLAELKKIEKKFTQLEFSTALQNRASLSFFNNFGSENHQWTLFAQQLLRQLRKFYSTWFSSGLHSTIPAADHSTHEDDTTFKLSEKVHKIELTLLALLKLNISAKPASFSNMMKYILPIWHLLDKINSESITDTRHARYEVQAAIRILPQPKPSPIIGAGATLPMDVTDSEGYDTDRTVEDSEAEPTLHRSAYRCTTFGYSAAASASVVADTDDADLHKDEAVTRTP